MGGSSQLNMRSNLLCNTMKIYPAKVIYYNSSSYVSLGKYHMDFTKIPRCFTSCKSTSNSYWQTSTSHQFPVKREQLLKEHKGIRKGDMVNLHDLLFTGHRDYVIRHNDGIDVQVKAAQLAGKVIVLYFLPLHHDYAYSRMSVSYLKDTYTYLLSDNVFEVVLVAYGAAEDMLLSDSYEDNQSHFESIFYHMPWTAIPFQDSESRERLVCGFAIDRLRCYGTSIVFDSSGMVLQSNSCKLFKNYGGPGYPFSDERIEFLEAQYAATAKEPSLKALLGSPKRDYVISNKGNKVLIDSLEEKLVALYFYEEGITPKSYTAELKKAYKECAQNNFFFEVVLIYLYDTSGTIDCTSEESFLNTFETMPWLALPFRDPKYECLMRFFDYPRVWAGNPLLHTLKVIGSHEQFFEPGNLEFLLKYNLPVFSEGTLVYMGTPGYYSSASKSSSYLQTYSNCPDNAHLKYHEALEETEREFKIIRKGDMINLHDLLFTKDRDHLVKHPDDQQVRAAHLAGKVIVLFFMPLNYGYLSSLSKSLLIDAYTYLLPDNNFEVVLVAYETPEKGNLSDFQPNSKETFDAIFSSMPWTAIPFSDISSRERLASRFGIVWWSSYIKSVVVDSTGMVLQSDCFDLLKKYGGLGYPFRDEWIEYLEIQDAATAKKPSLKALLGSPKRDYVISNKWDKVPIDTLEEKVVALFFYEEGTIPTWVTENIKKAYKELAQKKSCFEIVLIYLDDRYGSLGSTSEESFCNTFETMPWLAIPFKDPKCERLARFFGYPHNWELLEKEPTLVIFGPHGEYIEPWGADILCKFKLPAYPFTRERVAKLYTEKLLKLNLEMLWERNTIFRRKDENKVPLSQLLGRKIILFLEGNEECGDRRGIVVKFLSMLKESYFDMMGTSDEFEVIYITSGEKISPYSMLIADLPWFSSLESELLPVDLSLYCCYCHLLLAPALSTRSCGQCGKRGSGDKLGQCGKWGRPRSSMLAFDQDGRIVRKSLDLTFDDGDFPFCSATMEQETLRELNSYFSWGEMDKRHRGLRINSLDRNENLPYIYRSDFSDNITDALFDDELSDLDAGSN